MWRGWRSEIHLFYLTERALGALYLSPQEASGICFGLICTLTNEWYQSCLQVQFNFSNMLSILSRIDICGTKKEQFCRMFMSCFSSCSESGGDQRQPSSLFHIHCMEKNSLDILLAGSFCFASNNNLNSCSLFCVLVSDLCDQPV